MGNLKLVFSEDTIERVVVVIILFVLSMGGCRKSSSVSREAVEEQWKFVQQTFSEGRYQTALDLSKETIPSLARLSSDSSLSDIYFIVGHCYRHLGQYTNALASYQQSAEHANRIGDRRREAPPRIEIAKLYLRLRDYESAGNLSTTAAAAARVYSDWQNAGEAMLISIAAQRKLGRFDRAMRAIEDYDRIDSNLHDGRRPDRRFQELFFTLEASGNHKKLRELFVRWLADARARNDQTVLRNLFCLWGDYRMRTGQPDSAFQAYSQALTHVSGNASRSETMIVFASLGNAAYCLDQYDGARANFMEALRQRRINQDSLMTTAIELMILACDLHSSAAESEDATAANAALLTRAAELAEVSRLHGFIGTEALASLLMGRIEEERDNPRMAEKYYEVAYELYLRHPLLFSGESSVSPFLNAYLSAENITWHDRLRQLNASMSPEKTLEIQERLNHRELTEFFSECSLPLSNENAWRSIGSIRWMRHGLMLLQEDWEETVAEGSSASQERREALAGEYAQKMDDYETAFEKLGVVEQNIRWLVCPAMISAAKIKESIPRGSVLLEYVQLPHSLHIIAATTDTIVIRKVTVSRGNMLSLIGEYQQFLVEGKSIQRTRELSSVLNTLLIAPVEREIASASRLYIVPSEEFGWLPFHTLTPSVDMMDSVSGEIIRGYRLPLGARLPVSYLPSAVALFFNGIAPGSVRKIAGVGFTGQSGWDVEYEARDIRSFYEKAKLLFDTSATLHRLSNQDYDLVHIVAECRVNRTFPHASVLSLSDGTFAFGTATVPIVDLLTIPVPRAVVLSNVAAEPGQLSRYVPMLLLANGTPTVIATMWQGERRPKRYFGEVFYTSLSSGLPVTDAYHRAVKALTRHPEYAPVGRWGLYYAFGK